MLLQPYPVSLFKTKLTPTQHRVRHVRHLSSLQKESVNIQQTTTAKTFSPFPVSQKDKFNPAEFTHRSYNEFTHVNSVQTMKMGQKSWD